MTAPASPPDPRPTSGFLPDDIGTVPVDTLPGGRARTADAVVRGESVRESEARLRATFDLAPVGLAHVGIGGEFLRVNRRLCELLGHAESALLARRWQDITHADDRASGLDQLLRVLAGEMESFSIEQRCVRGDGGTRWLRFSASLVREPSPDGFPGRPRWAVVVVDDAGVERDGMRLAGERLAELETIYAHAPAGLCVLDRELRWVRINERLAAMNGFPATAHLGRSVRELLPHLADAIEPTLHHVLHTGEPVFGHEIVEPLPRHAGGVRQWVASYLPLRDRAGEVIGINVLAEDVSAARATDRERERLQDAEHAARAAAEREARRLATLNEAAALLASTLELPTVLDRLAALMLDPLGEVVQLFLIEGEEIKRTLLAARDPQRRAALDGLARRPAPRTSGPTPVATVIRTHQPLLLARVGDGLLRTLCEDAAHYQLMRDVGFRSMLVLPMIVRERVMGAVAVGRSSAAEPFTHEDLAYAEQLVRHAALAVENARAYESEQCALAEANAARREAERERQAAERANVAKAQFLATMSHELRTPLNAIAGHVQLVELGVHGPLTGAQADALDRVQKAQRHLLGLINDVLNFARLETGRVSFAMAEVDVAEVTAEVVGMMEGQAEARRLTLDLRRAMAPSQAWADPDKVRQVLLNLLSNALKFTPPGGRVIVDFPSRVGGAGRSHVYVRVRDTGVGISRDKLAHVFDPFVQVHAVRNPLTREQEGTGLGLSISRDLARGMGGELRARSVEGRGAAFTLALRRADAGDRPDG